MAIVFSPAKYNVLQTETLMADANQSLLHGRMSGFSLVPIPSVKCHSVAAIPAPWIPNVLSSYELYYELLSNVLRCVSLCLILQAQLLNRFGYLELSQQSAVI